MWKPAYLTLLQLVIMIGLSVRVISITVAADNFRSIRSEDFENEYTSDVKDSNYDGYADYEDPQLFSFLDSEDIEHLNEIADRGVSQGVFKLHLNPHHPEEKHFSKHAARILKRLLARLGPSFSYTDIRSKISIHTVNRENQKPTDGSSRPFAFDTDYHNDACCFEDCASWYEQYSDGLQRRVGVIIWLNSDYEGGHTTFPNIGLSIRGPTGWALKFNLLQTGTLFCHDSAVHNGELVTKGTKRILVVFINAPPEWMQALPGPKGYNASFALNRRRSLTK